MVSVWKWDNRCSIQNAPRASDKHGLWLTRSKSFHVVIKQNYHFTKILFPLLFWQLAFRLAPLPLSRLVSFLSLVSLLTLNYSFTMPAQPALWFATKKLRHYVRVGTRMVCLFYNLECPVTIDFVDDTGLRQTPPVPDNVEYITEPHFTRTLFWMVHATSMSGRVCCFWNKQY